jgi:hypothetical protein
MQLKPTTKRLAETQTVALLAVLYSCHFAIVGGMHILEFLLKNASLSKLSDPETVGRLAFFLTVFFFFSS